MQLFSAEQCFQLFFCPQKVEKITPKSCSEVLKKNFTLGCPNCQTEEFMFQNMAYRPTVYRTGDKTIKSVVPFPAPAKRDNLPLPRKLLKCSENLPPSPSPETRGGDREGGPPFNVPFHPL